MENKEVLQVIKPIESIEYLMSPIGQELKNFELLQRQARMYCTSTIVPKEYQGEDKMGNVIIAMDMAKRLNANLLMVMQNLNVIQGRPAWSAKFLIATVNSCGRFNPIQYRFLEKGFVGKIQVNELAWDNLAKKNTYKKTEFDGSNIMNIECIAYTTQKGSDQVLESSPIDVKTAILEGWYTKNGSKWPNMTKQMLMYRAASWWNSVYSPDLSMGLSTIEEVEDSRVIDLGYMEEVKEEKRHISFESKAEAIKESATSQPAEADNKQEELKAAQQNATPKADTPESLFK